MAPSPRRFPLPRHAARAGLARRLLLALPGCPGGGGPADARDAAVELTVPSTGGGGDAAASDGGADLAAPVDAAMPVANCLAGWYLAVPYFPSCQSVVDPPHECGAPDCERWRFRGYLGGEYLSGELSYSVTTRSVSGSASSLGFSPVDGGYRIETTGFVGVVTDCTAAGMRVNGVAFERPPAALAQGLDDAIPDGGAGFRGAPLP